MNTVARAWRCEPGKARREIRPDAGFHPVEDRVFRRNAVQAKQIRARSRWLMNSPGWIDVRKARP